MSLSVFFFNIFLKLQEGLKGKDSSVQVLFNVKSIEPFRENGLSL